jgi:hypothetical protein
MTVVGELCSVILSGAYSNQTEAFRYLVKVTDMHKLYSVTSLSGVLQVGPHLTK